MPEVPKIEKGAPKPDDLEDLDGVIARMRDKEATVRDSAAREVLEAKPSWVSAIAHRIDEIADKANRDDMRRVLEDSRRKARSAEREKREATGKRGKIETPDYLVMLVEFARPDSKAWQDLVAVVGMSRMLVQIGTVESTRELIEIYTRFGEFLRVDVQLQLAKMGDKAIAGLIEARRHKAEKVAKWSERQLDALGKAIPSEAVQTEDYQVLADVLRAYGRVRDPDAGRIVISFANTERAQVREAARQSVAMMGDVANWQLRDSYEDIIGKKPPRDWTWDRTARELFGEFDRQRLAQVYRLFDEGMKAKAEGSWDAMREAWDKVLARSPMFARRAEMVPGYVELANKKLDDDPVTALAALRRAERLTEDESERKKIQSLALTLEAEQLARRGIADQVLFNRALQLDADNARARDALARAQRGETVEKRRGVGRYGSALAIAIAALAALLVIALRRGRRNDELDSAPKPETAPDADASETEAAPPDEDASETEVAPPDEDASEPEAAPPDADTSEPAAAPDDEDASEVEAAPTAPSDPQPEIEAKPEAQRETEPDDDAPESDDDER